MGKIVWFMRLKKKYLYIYIYNFSFKKELHILQVSGRDGINQVKID